MVDEADNVWMPASHVIEVLLSRSTLSPSQADCWLKDGVTSDQLETQDGKRWSEFKEHYGDTDLRLCRQRIGNSKPRRNPLSRYLGPGNQADPPTSPLSSLPMAWDNFKADQSLDRHLNLQKVMMYMQDRGVTFKPAPPIEKLDLDAPSPPKAGRKEHAIWQSLEIDLLLWLERNHADDKPPILARLNEWAEQWFLDQGFEKEAVAQKRGKAKREMPSEGAIANHTKAVWERYAASRRRETEKAAKSR